MTNSELATASCVAATTTRKPLSVEFTGKNSVVARVGKKVVGAAYAWQDSLNRFVILKSAVSAPYRRRGVATAMYRAIETKAGVNLTPAASLSDDAFQFWQRYRPEAVAEDLRHRAAEVIGAKVVADGRVATIIKASGGIAIARYDDAVEGATNSETAIRRSELDAAIAEAAASLQAKPAPPTTPIQGKEAFDLWFDSSKVVGDDGAPLVVYHGTKRNFEDFSTDFDDATARGTYFTVDPKYANQYAGTNEYHRTQVEGGNVVPAYLAVKNPKTVSADEYWKAIRADTENELVRQATLEGYDGVVVRSFVDSLGPADMWIVFRAEQIKNAIGLNARFAEFKASPGSIKPSIRKARVRP